MSRSRLLSCLAALAVLAATPGCGRIEKVLAFGATAQGIDRSVVLDPPSRAKGASCAGRLVNTDLLAPPPGIPTLEQTSWLLGRAVPGRYVFLGWVADGKGQREAVRDALVHDARSRGYVVDAGQWDNDQLRLSITGAADIAVTVQPYCKGYLALRYVVRDLQPTTVALPTPAVGARRACPDLRAIQAPVELSPEQALLPFPVDATPLLVGVGGDATVYTAIADGTDPAAARDALVPSLASAGYVVGRPEARGGIAQAALVGRRSGALTVQPWCKGRLAVRYALTPYVEREQSPARAARPCAGREDVLPLPDPVPAWLSYPGEIAYREQVSPTFRLWTARRTTALNDLGAPAKVVAGLGALLATGGVRQVPVAGPLEEAATALAGPEGTALLVARTVCAEKVDETYVVPR